MSLAQSLETEATAPPRGERFRGQSGARDPEVVKCEDVQRHEKLRSCLRSLRLSSLRVARRSSLALPPVALGAGSLPRGTARVRVIHR